MGLANNQTREIPMKSNFARNFSIACICASAALGSKTAAARTAPCSLLTSAQVTAAVGVRVGAAQPAETGDAPGALLPTMAALIAVAVI
jgi:hypothetical protein